MSPLKLKTVRFCISKGQELGSLQQQREITMLTFLTCILWSFLKGHHSQLLGSVVCWWPSSSPVLLALTASGLNLCEKWNLMWPAEVLIENYSITRSSQHPWETLRSSICYHCPLPTGKHCSIPLKSSETLSDLEVHIMCFILVCDDWEWNLFWVKAENWPQMWHRVHLVHIITVFFPPGFHLCNILKSSLNPAAEYSCWDQGSNFATFKLPPCRTISTRKQRTKKGEVVFMQTSRS